MAVHLARCGWRIAGVNDIDEKQAFKCARYVPTGVFHNLEYLALKSQILFLCVPDFRLIEVAEQIGEFERIKSNFLIHFSGILPADVLDLASMNSASFSLHPFASIPPMAIDKNPFRNAEFFGEGDKTALPLAQKIVADLGGIYNSIDPNCKPFYHLAASMVANHLFSLFSASEDLLEKCGFSKETKTRMITKLTRTALRNYSEKGLRDGLTGPLVRKDEMTMAEHNLIAKKVDHHELYRIGMEELKRIIQPE